jgi:hypothetical protein
VNRTQAGMMTAVVIVVIVSVFLLQPKTPTPNPYLNCPDCNATVARQTSSETYCKIINDILPDPKCTPGAIDPGVTQDNIDSTICVSGYTKTIRPPVSVTEPQKLESMKSYEFYDSPRNYEFDHLIPLELGGAPDDMKNLWPEPHPSSFDKDGFENYLHKQVCSGSMDLKTAQNEIDTNWVKYWNDAGKP